ncbi:MAG: Xaa-Pro peptidase family protein [bacterium]
MTKARFIYDVSERNSDLYYATRFWAPDAFIFFVHKGKKYMVMNDLEFDRASREARVHRVLSINDYVKRAEAKKKQPGQADVIHEIFSSLRIRRLEVPQGMSFALVDALRKRGYKIEAGPHPFFPARLEKDSEEKRHVLDAQRAVFASMAMVRDLLAKSRIKGRRLVCNGSALTSERLRTMINVFLMERGYTASDTIAACGKHSIDPHDVGAGPIRPHEPIIVDIFPRSIKTLFFGDATRTFCKGRAPDALKKLYAAVKEGQKLGLSMVRAGINGRGVHDAILALFVKRGYQTGEKDGRRQGFFHGTGHGIGLELHEEPVRITHRDYILKKGNCVSVEPGLYYEGVGGVRIEDIVYVTAKGCEVLGSFPKELEIR